MRDEDRLEFAEAWTSAMDLYGREVSDMAIELAFHALEPLSIQEVQAGLTAHVRNPDTGQFPPKPADVIRNVHGSSQSAAMEAWAKVDKAIRSVGQYRDVVFDDWKIHAAVEQLGGWIETAQTSADEYPFLRNRFVKLYEGFTVQPPKRYPYKLLGIASRDNAHGSFERGRPAEQVAVIGDRSKAREVYRLGKQESGAPIHHADTVEKIESKTKRLSLKSA